MKNQKIQKQKSMFSSSKSKYNFDFIVDSDSNLLSLITALMVFIASLSAVCVIGVNNLFNSWNQDLNGQVTVQVLPFGKNNKPLTKTELKEKTNNIITDLRLSNIFSKIRLIKDNEIDDMLKPWLGSSIEDFNIPVPDLLDVSFKTFEKNNNHTNLSEIGLSLKEKFGPISIENHNKWLKDIRKIKNSVQFIAYFILVAIIITTSVTVIYTTNASFKSQKHSIEVFHLIGAFDEFIAKQFANSVFRLTFIGSMIGFILFLIIFGIISVIISDLTGTIFDYIELSFIDWMTIISIPFISAIIAKATAKNTILQIIGKVK